MKQPLFESIEKELGRFRETSESLLGSPFGCRSGESAGLCNLVSSDSLGLASDKAVMEKFFRSFAIPEASPDLERLGKEKNKEKCRRLEHTLKTLYGAEAALVFGSAYHANTGIISAIADESTEIFFDQNVHATLAAGIRLSGLKHDSYPHKDMIKLRMMLMASQAKNPNCSQVVVTESVFSEEGDLADLRALAALKHEMPNVLLYVDEAEAVGVRGATGLGLGEEMGTLGDIDLLVGVFGKALASNGAFVIVSDRVRGCLIEKMRGVNLNIALPPINLRWTSFIVETLAGFGERRRRLMDYGQAVAAAVCAAGRPCVSASHIVSMAFGSDAECVVCSQKFIEAGFYALPRYSKSVPARASHIRLSLRAGMDPDEIKRLIHVIGS